MDLINKILDKTPVWVKTLFDHNRWKTLFILGFATFSGCMLFESRTASIKDPEKMVTRMQLNAEFETTLGLYKAAIADLDSKDALKQTFLQVAQGLATELPSPVGALTVSGIGLLLGSLGGVVDKRRADQQIEKLKSQTGTVGAIPSSTLAKSVLKP